MTNWLKKQFESYQIGHRHVSFEFMVKEYNTMVLFVVPFVLVIGILSAITPKFLPISIPLIVLMVGILVILDNRLEQRRAIELICRVNNIDDYYSKCPKCTFKKLDGTLNLPTNEQQSNREVKHD